MPSVIAMMHKEIVATFVSIMVPSKGMGAIALYNLKSVMPLRLPKEHSGPRTLQSRKAALALMYIKWEDRLRTTMSEPNRAPNFTRR